jgi:hypothetical protein
LVSNFTRAKPVGVTGSVNASAAPYVVSQGTALARSGGVLFSPDDEGLVWVGGGTITCINNDVDI